MSHNIIDIVLSLLHPVESRAFRRFTFNYVNELEITNIIFTCEDAQTNVQNHDNRNDSEMWGLEEVFGTHELHVRIFSRTASKNS